MKKIMIALSILLSVANQLKSAAIELKVKKEEAGEQKKAAQAQATKINRDSFADDHNEDVGYQATKSILEAIDHKRCNVSKEEAELLLNLLFQIEKFKKGPVKGEDYRKLLDYQVISGDKTVYHVSPITTLQNEAKGTRVERIAYLIIDAKEDLTMENIQAIRESIEQGFGCCIGAGCIIS